jgi:hypothetical protein
MTYDHWKTTEPEPPSEELEQCPHCGKHAVETSYVYNPRTNQDDCFSVCRACHEFVE